LAKDQSCADLLGAALFCLFCCFALHFVASFDGKREGGGPSERPLALARALAPAAELG
jgi:hypothetical protein